MAANLRRRLLFAFLGTSLCFLVWYDAAGGVRSGLASDIPPRGAETRLLWHDPGAVETLDFAGGPGGREGAPLAPFIFHEEDTGGTSPKLLLKDANRVLWSVKFGKEARPETFATRLVWAAGYFVEPTHFVAQGKIDAMGHIGFKAETVVNRAGGNTFTNARFERRSPGIRFQGDTWSFVDNPFLGTPQINGLKIMMMLLSNWDVKDSRSSSGPNTAILRVEKEGQPVELRYVVTDWGATMGKWGGYFTRTRWNCDAFAGQTEHFVTGEKGGLVGFGFSGKHTTDMTDGIRTQDVRWLMQYLGRVTDQQLRDGLQASGATPEEVDCFTRSLRLRIEQLRAVAR